MRKYVNQIIAKEGVLPYREHGYVLKRWEDLKSYIGQKRPVWDSHENSKVIGYAEIKKCPIGQNLLCADITITDDTIPERNGYSIGAPSTIVDSPGFFGAFKYDKIQMIQDIEHIAYINSPRDPQALQTNDTFVTNHVFINGENNSTLILCDEYLIEKEKKKMDQEQKSPETKVVDHSDEIEKLKAENKKLNDQFVQLSGQYSELFDMFKESLVKEINGYVSIITDADPEFKYDEKKHSKKMLEFGAGLVSKLKGTKKVEDGLKEKVIQTKAIKELLIGDDDEINLNSAYLPKGGV